jgi:hypothetical protein
MSQWQYHIEKYTLKELADPGYLNSLGKQGWELIFLDRLSGTRSGIEMKWLAVFKKQLAEKKA